MNWILLLSLICILIQVEVCYLKLKPKLTIIAPAANLISIIVFSIIFFNKGFSIQSVFNNILPLVLSFAIVLTVFIVKKIKLLNQKNK